MKKYFNKAIFYKEFKTAKWFMLALLLGFVTAFYSKFTSLVKYINKSVGEGNFGVESKYDALQNINRVLNWDFLGGSYIFIVLIIIALAAAIFGGDKRNRKSEVLGSMNFKREEIIGTKWLTGIIVIVVPLVAEFIYMEIMYFGNSNLKLCGLTQKMTFQWLIINFLTLTFIYTFIMFIECLCGKEILGGILGSIFLILPVGLSGLVPEFISFFMKDVYKVENPVFIKISNYMMEFAKKTTLAGYNMGYEENFQIKLVVLLISITTLCVLSVFAFKNIDFEKIGYVSMFRPLEYVLKIGVSICFGMLISIIAAANIKRESYSSMSTIAGVTFVISIILVYFITDKFIEMSKN